MNNTLSSNEVSVLQENLDLFATLGEKVDEARAAPSGDKRPTSARRRRKSTARTVASSSTSTSAKTSGAALKNFVQPRLIDSEEPPHLLAPLKSETLLTTDTPPLPLISSDQGPHILGVRSPSITQAKDQLLQKDLKVENYAIEKRDPALRNVTEALVDHGVELKKNNRLLYWFLVSGDRSTADFLQLDDIEIAINCAWFETQKSAIRRLKGADYINACSKIAGQALSQQGQRPLVQS